MRRPDLAHLVAAGRGERPSDLVLRGGMVFDVVTGATIEGDVAILGDTIVGIGASYDGARVIDVSRLTLVPGFVDTHLHLESSLVTPFEFDRCVCPRGVTTAICDPHEIANVLGVAGIEYVLDAALRTVMDIRVQLSSCVPSTEMETSGARVDAAALSALRSHPAALGLAEVMNYPAVLAGDTDMLAKIEAFRDAPVDGHAPRLGGRDLNGYIAAGIRTEHEATTAEEALEKLVRGMRILIREGSVSKDLGALLPILTERNASHLAFCTDDRNPLDIAEAGHLDYMIRYAIEHGASPLAVYRAASLSGAEAFGLRDRGRIAPGLRADIVALGSLAACDARLVLCRGVEVGAEAFEARGEIAPIGRDSVRPPRIGPETFRLAGEGDEAHVIGIVPGQIITRHLRERVAAQGGDRPPDPGRDLARIAVIERHGINGNVACGFVRGFALEAGAIASTVCHDHHNIACVGVDYDDMALACERLAAIEGGFVVARGGEILAELALPVAGLMSLEPFEAVAAGLSDLRQAARSLGVTLEEPFLQLAFLALPVIPSLKITDCGMIDVERFEILD